MSAPVLWELIRTTLVWKYEDLEGANLESALETYYIDHPPARGRELMIPLVEESVNAGGTPLRNGGIHKIIRFAVEHGKPELLWAVMRPHTARAYRRLYPAYAAGRPLPDPPMQQTPALQQAPALQQEPALQVQ